MRWVAACAVLLGGCTQQAAEPTEVVVFAAASLSDVLETFAADFERMYPAHRVVLNVAATSLLARQIAQGAPADIFLSANQEWVDYLVQRGRVQGAAHVLAGNRLVVAGAHDQAPLAHFDFILHFKSIAVADPSHVPAGMYAKEALECSGLWDVAAPRLVPTLDVRTALLSATSGAAEVAIVYASDVPVDQRAQVLLEWPAGCAPAIHYVGARIAAARNPVGAADFLTLLADSANVRIWEQHGFAKANP